MPNSQPTAPRQVVKDVFVNSTAELLRRSRASSVDVQREHSLCGPGGTPISDISMLPAHRRLPAGSSASRQHQPGPQRLCTRARHIANALAQLEPSTSDVAAAKAELLSQIAPTGRGYRAGRNLRGTIEEAQVAVEAHAGPELPFELLEGKWKLVYTTAADVLPILGAETRLAPPGLPSPVQVGNIYQQFSSVEEGIVENVIQLSTPLFLQERNGVTITVKARYAVQSPHRISLAFEEAQVGQIRISEFLESALNPAMLPRSSLQHALLLFFREFNLRIPFNSARQLATRVAGSNDAVMAGGNYQLTYLDEDMLIGRATALGGSFIFTREAV